MWHRGDVIRKLRDAQGWSQADLAKRSGLHERSVARAEANNPTVSMDVWYKLATTLGTTMEDIQALLEGFQRVTPPVTGAGHPAGLSPEAAVETPKTRLVHFVLSLSEEQATVLLPLVLQWFAKLVGGVGGEGKPPARR